MIFSLSAAIVVMGDRFFPPITKKQQPMFSLKINIPTYKSNSWGQLEKHGDLQVSSNVDSLSDGYENQIVIDLHQLVSEIDSRQTTLRHLNQKIEVAKAQLQKLEIFLRRLGIDPTSYSLDISSNPALDAAIMDEPEAVAAEVEVDPIPFDSEGHSHEF
jgi:hypothetical protein